MGGGATEGWLRLNAVSGKRSTTERQRPRQRQQQAASISAAAAVKITKMHFKTTAHPHHFPKANEAKEERSNVVAKRELQDIGGREDEGIRKGQGQRSSGLATRRHPFAVSLLGVRVFK